MAHRRTENPGLSPAAQLEGVEFPASRDAIVIAAEDNGASVDAINLLKSLPRDQYASREDVLRDFAEASRRFAAAADAKDAIRDRRNLGKEMVENAPPGKVRHP